MSTPDKNTVGDVNGELASAFFYIEGLRITVDRLSEMRRKCIVPLTDLYASIEYKGMDAKTAHFIAALEQAMSDVTAALAEPDAEVLPLLVPVTAADQKEGAICVVEIRPELVIEDGECIGILDPIPESIPVLSAGWRAKLKPPSKDDLEWLADHHLTYRAPPVAGNVPPATNGLPLPSE